MSKKTVYIYTDIGIEGIVANNSVGANNQALTSDGNLAYWGLGGGGGGNVDGGVPNSVYGGTTFIDGGSI